MSWSQKNNMLVKLAVLLALLASALSHKGNEPVVTLISGFWDVGRGALNSGFRRTNEYYLSYFERLLQTEANMIIFGDATLQKFVANKRRKPNTLFILRDLESFRSRWHTQKILKIIQGLKGKPVWGNYGQFPQYNLQMYNPVVMSKLFLMTEAIDQDIFNSDFFVWADAGLLHNYEQFQDSFVPKNVLESFEHIFQGPWYFHVYTDASMFRGYDQSELRYMKNRVPSNQVVLANYFGGRIEVVSTMKAVYENFLRITLENGDLGTDESVFSMMLIRFPYLIPLINFYEMREFANRYKIQSKHYLSYQQHRVFKIKKNEQHQVEHLSVRKGGAQAQQIKQSFDIADKEIRNFSNQPIKMIPSQQIKEILTPSPQKPEVIIPIQQPPTITISFVPALLSETLVSYKLMLIHRVIYAFVTLGLYFYIINQKHIFKIGSFY